MTFYEELNKANTEAGKRLIEYEKECLVFVADFLAGIRTALGWPEQMFQRLDIGEQAPDFATRGPKGYINDQGLHFAFRISLANWFIQFKWAARRTADGHFAVQATEDQTFTIRPDDMAESLKPAVQYVCESLRGQVQHANHGKLFK